MRSYETRKAVLFTYACYLASDIKVLILSFMRIDYDVYDLACIQLYFVCVIDMSLYLICVCLCSCKRDIYHSK